MKRTHDEYMADIKALQEFEGSIFNVCCSKMVGGIGYQLGRNSHNWVVRDNSGNVLHQATQITSILDYWYNINNNADKHKNNNLK